MNRITILALSFIFFFNLVLITFAQDSLVREDSGGSVDLGRRGKIVNDQEDDGWNNGVGIGLGSDAGLGVFDAFFASLSMILVSEIGDETFIIAALMAMRHPKSIVLSGALSALIIMTLW
ncbi:hypothetical protein TanjilG_25072 [Lupinus angustifolius]|uniref:GDT1 family protein n=1 Tax=Lupinus angustifolius TaxID=3871 RepID=A0A394DC39_LUPAN|nr:hypothetical protein TanjilG_25072 [Lupinus angustifolius]